MRISDWSSDVCSSDLSVLQWAAPSVDQALFQRLLSQGGGEAGLASGDRASQAVIEGRATLSVVFVEKRSQSGRLPWHAAGDAGLTGSPRSEEHTSELQSLMRISYAVFCLKKKKKNKEDTSTRPRLNK